MLRWLAFPLILGVALAAAMSLASDLGAPLALVVSQGGAAVAIAVAERLLPFESEWNRSHGDVLTDICHAIVSGISTTQMMRPVAAAVGVAVAGFLSRAWDSGLWPVQWHPLAQLALALVIAELPQYWLHRWQHEKEWLWRFHAVHHSAPRLYWLNAARFHPVDLGLLYFVGYVPLVVLGCPESTIMLFALFDAVFGMLQHSNIDVRLGIFNRIFSMAEPHRWHHSLELREANTNYGSNLIVWDLVFGTFFLPSRRQSPSAIGIAALPAFPGGYVAQLAAPFRWKQLQTENQPKDRFPLPLRA
jgi:sterol desaturase/sphingolipid hydroxylase (fatty acid hydroxylase superfamily)